MHKNLPIYLDLLEKEVLQNGYTGVRVDKGRKYHRVVVTGKWQNHVHCFVDDAGNIYKAKGWKAPVKDARFSLDTDLPILRKVMHFAGGYLYKGAVSAQDVPWTDQIATVLPASMA